MVPSSSSLAPNHGHHQPAASSSSASSSILGGETVSTLRPAGSSLSVASIENIVNPLGTVTTIVRSSASGGGADRDPMVDSFQSSDIAFPDQYIHENCDEALFRPVVQIVQQPQDKQNSPPPPPQTAAPVRMNTNLIVPVIVPPTEEEKKAKSLPKFVEPPRVAVEKPVVVDVQVEVEEEMKPETVEILPEPEKQTPQQEVIVEEVEQVFVKPQGKQSKQKNKRNKEKTPPVVVAPPAPVVVEVPAKTPIGSKGRKSSGQEPKAGKIRKSEKNNEIIDATVVSEEEAKEIEEMKEEEKQKNEDLVEVEKPPEKKVEVEEEAEFDQLPEVELVIPSKEEMEIIQDSLLKDTIVTVVPAITTSNTNSGGGGGKKNKKNRQKQAINPPKVELEVEEEKHEMIVDISETKYDLTECISTAAENDCEFEGMGMYTDPLLVPLEPFDPKQVANFDVVVCPVDAELEELEDESLMTFESPVIDKKADGGEEELEEEEEEVETDTQKLHKMFADRNLVFALCTSLREDREELEKEELEENAMEQSAIAEDVQLSSVPGWQLEIHEDYMDLDRSEKKQMMMESLTKMEANKLTASTGSSEEEVSSSSNSGGGNTTTTATEDDEEGGGSMGRGKVTVTGDDEELQPLIKDKEDEEDFASKNAEEDVEALSVAQKSGSSKESTPAPQGGGGGKSGGGSKKKSRKKKR